MIKDISLRVSPETASSRELLAPKVFGAAGCKVNDWKVVRRSIDARKRDIIINLTVRVASGEDPEVPSGYVPVEFHDVSSSKETVIIVGAGPAGLFGALECIRLGMRPIVLERGKDVESRRLDSPRLIVKER